MAVNGDCLRGFYGGLHIPSPGYVRSPNSVCCAVCTGDKAPYMSYNAGLSFISTASSEVSHSLNSTLSESISPVMDYFLILIFSHAHRPRAKAPDIEPEVSSTATSSALIHYSSRTQHFHMPGTFICPDQLAYKARFVHSAGNTQHYCSISTIDSSLSVIDRH